MKKRGIKILSCILILILILAAGVLGYLLLVSGSEDREYDRERSAQLAARPEEDEEPGNYLADCLLVNPDTVAWITIPDTVIDFPVVQGEDNSYYLTHSFENEESKFGVPFLDYRCSGDFSDFNSIIYGHNFTGGRIFGSLTEFQNEEYFDAHPTGILYTNDEKYCIYFFACLVVKNDAFVYNTIFVRDTEQETYLQEIRNQAVQQRDFDPAELAERNLLLLSTCSYEFQDARTILIGYLEKSD
jgi:sortase B